MAKRLRLAMYFVCRFSYCVLRNGMTFVCKEYVEQYSFIRAVSRLRRYTIGYVINHARTMI